MNRTELKAILSDNGFIPHERDNGRYNKGNMRIDLDFDSVLCDSDRDFSNRSQYPIIVRYPSSERELYWLIKKTEYLLTDEGHRDIVMQNKTIFREYPRFFSYNEKRIEII